MKETIESMKNEQLELKPIFIKEKIENIKLVAGVDISYYKKDNIEMGVCCIVVWDMINKIPLQVVFAEDIMNISYISGFLCFREYPLFVKAFNKLLIKPDVFIFDGNGTLHERKAGLATYAGVKSRISSIGVSKNKYKAENIYYEDENNKLHIKDSVYKIYRKEKEENELIGYTYFSKDNKPIYISSGNLVKQSLAKEIVIKCCSKEHSVPEPTRLADRFSRDYIKNGYNDNINIKELCYNYCLNNDLKNYNNFIYFLKNYGFFKNLSKDEITNILKKDGPINLSLSIKKNKDIIISIYYRKDKNIIEIGIDPKNCFNSLYNSSILANFPMNNRTYLSFINHLEKIFNEKNDIHKIWLKEANSYWNGKWAKF